MAQIPFTLVIRAFSLTHHGALSSGKAFLPSIFSFTFAFSDEDSDEGGVNQEDDGVEGSHSPSFGCHGFHALAVHGRNSAYIS
jgi:hypothetical protein